MFWSVATALKQVRDYPDAPETVSAREYLGEVVEAYETSAATLMRVLQSSR